MSLVRKQQRRTRRRALRTRNQVKAVSSLPRVSVFRSLKQIYAQLVDDVNHKTIVSASSLELEKAKGDKKSVAKQVGLELARRAQEKGISSAAFDRGAFLYHGRIKELAEGLREGGLRI